MAADDQPLGGDQQRLEDATLSQVSHDRCGQLRDSGLLRVATGLERVRTKPFDRPHGHLRAGWWGGTGI